MILLVQLTALYGPVMGEAIPLKDYLDLLKLWCDGKTSA